VPILNPVVCHLFMYLAYCLFRITPIWPVLRPLLLAASTGYDTDWTTEKSQFDSQKTLLTTILRLTQPPTQPVPGGLFPGGKRGAWGLGSRGTMILPFTLACTSNIFTCLTFKINFTTTNLYQTYYVQDAYRYTPPVNVA
jgi:hypothetical protein